jgi:HD-like signal output (HDOD) protein
MAIYFLALLVVAGGAIGVRPVLRRALGSGGAVTGQPVEVSAEIEVVFEPPVDLAQLPEPPVLQAASVQILDRAQILSKLRELELGVSELGQPLPNQNHIVEAALAAIGDAATQRRYTPRRPNLLPHLMRAINDEDTSRREMSALIARDPALVGSLLKMANSAFYRVSYRQVETIERAIVMLGSDGLRSLVAAALMQPIFQVSATGRFQRFPEIVWEHALRSAHAAIPHAALVERADAFAAELLCLISGLAEIVLFRAAMDHYATSRHGDPDPAVIASLLDSQSAAVALQLGADWELSDLMLAALQEQMGEGEPTSPLGRSLRFGRCAGALAVLHTNSIIDDATVRLSLPEAGLSPSHLKCMWTRLLQQHEDPRTPRKRAA